MNNPNPLVSKAPPDLVQIQAPVRERLDLILEEIHRIVVADFDMIEDVNEYLLLLPITVVVDAKPVDVSLNHPDIVISPSIEVLVLAEWIGGMTVDLVIYLRETLRGRCARHEHQLLLSP